MSTLTVGTISEKVTDAGVAVDGVTLKDGGAVFTSAVTATDNTVDLGASSTRFKDLYLSGGVYLGGTGSANYLQDYETGTFTPTYTASSSNPTVTYSIQTGVYVKVGKLVHIQGRIRINSVSGGSGTLFISGLPFSNYSTGNYFSSMSIGYSSGFNTNHPSTIYMGNGHSYLHLVRFNSTSAIGGRTNVIQVSDMNNATNQCDVMFTGTFSTD